MQSLHSELLHSLGYCNECAHLLVRACIQSRQLSRAAAEYLWVAGICCHCSSELQRNCDGVTFIRDEQTLDQREICYLYRQQMCVCVSALAT